MTYGLRVIGDYGQTQIDENYSNVFPLSDTPTTRAAYEEIPSTPITDLHIGRMATGVSGFVAGIGCPTSYLTHTLRPFAGNQTPPSSGLGLKVMNSAGQLAYTSTVSSKCFDVVLMGTVINQTVTWPLGTVSDLDKYWCVLNNTYDYYIQFEFGVFQGFMSFGYYWTSGTSGYINLQCYNQTYTNLPFNYMIMKERG